MGTSPLSRDEIRDLVAEALKQDPAELGFDDNLVELGLHSIGMIKLAARWRRAGFSVNFSDLALAPTVQDWFDLLTGNALPPPRQELPTAQPDAEAESFGLAVMQHGYWIGRGDNQALGGVAAHLYAEFDSTGLDPVRLERAVHRLVRRHGMLRSQFLPDGTQRILDEPGLPVWELVDLRELNPDDTEARLAEIRERKTHQRMPAELGKVLDIALTLRPDGKTRLHVDVDMLAADALSYRVFMADLAGFYVRDADDTEPIGYTYRQYLRDHAAANEAALERERQWWAERVPDLPDAPALPLVPESDRENPLRTVRYDHWLNPEQKRLLFDRAHARRVTPAMVLASVFAEIVGNWSGSQRFLLNLPLFNREPTHADVESMVGDFSSSVLLDIDVTAPRTATQRARALQESLHTSASHSSYPGLDVLRDLGRSRGEPVLASMVYTSGLNLGELFAESVLDTFGDPVWIISQGPQVVLDAQVVELRGGLLLNWDVREQAFPPGMMDAMFARHREVITVLLADDAAWDQPIVDGLPAGQAEVRTRVNDTTREKPERLLHEDFFHHAESTPDSPAVVWGDGGTLTYDQLRDQALRVAGALVTRGVRVGDAVSVQLPKGPDQIVAALGVLAAGASYVPIGFDQPDARRDQIQRTGMVTLALTAGGQAQDTVPSLSIEEATRSGERLAGPVAVQPDTVAYVLFTSGSTGEPKGVEVPHSAAMNTIDYLDEYFGVGPADRSFGLSALEFDLSVYDIFGLLSAGGSVVVVDDETRRDGDLAARLLRETRPTVLNCVPGLLEMLLDSGAPLGDSLRAVLLGGDWVAADLPGRLRERVPGCRFAGLGGTTETAIHSTVCEVPGEAPVEWKAVPYGVPLGNVCCRVVNEVGGDCPDWVAGELWIGGDGVALGYRGDPGRTADRFVEYQGKRWYRTGDLARYLPDGTLEFLGRRDHQVKIRGYRVELGEVEAALRAVPGVGRAVAEPAGTRSLAAAVTGDVEPEAVKAGVATLLPHYMVPERITVFDDFPLTANGKLDRKAIRRRLDTGSDDVETYRAPETDLEAALADVLAQVLGRPRLGTENDFFACGGDSVLATAAMARVREWLDTTEAAVADLLAARTVRALAARLSERQAVPGRLEEVAAVYLEVASLTDDEVAAEAAG